MLSTASNLIPHDSVRSNEDTGSSLADLQVLTTILDLERQIQAMDHAILPLSTARQQLETLDKELARTAQMLRDEDVQRKLHVLRQRRVQLWNGIKRLPALKEQRRTLVHNLQVFLQTNGLL